MDFLYIIVSSVHDATIASFRWYLVFLHYFFFSIFTLQISFSYLIALSVLSVYCSYCLTILRDSFLHMVWLLWPQIMGNYADRVLNIKPFLHVHLRSWCSTEFCLRIYYLMFFSFLILWICIVCVLLLSVCVCVCVLSLSGLILVSCCLCNDYIPFSLTKLWKIWKNRKLICSFKFVS